MRITDARFIQGIIGTTEILDDGTPQVAFIGRSNAGKSSVINILTNQKKLARTSAMPGRTQEINLFKINRSLYFLDLPGYGYAKASKEDRVWLHKLINWYLFKGGYQPKKIVLILDAELGPTELDFEMINALLEYKKPLVIVANKIDKIRKPDYANQMEKLKTQLPNVPIIPFSAKRKIGVGALLKEIL